MLSFFFDRSDHDRIVIFLGCCDREDRVVDRGALWMSFVFWVIRVIVVRCLCVCGERIVMEG